MPFARNLADGLRSLFRRDRINQELNEELNGFLEMAAEEKMERGIDRKEARRSVRLEHGSLDATKEEIRSAGWESFVETCWQDLRFAFRMLRRAPGFATVAVLTLALGVGANTAIFSVYAVLLKPLPYARADQVFNLFQANPQEGIAGTGWSYPNMAELHEQNHVFTAVAGAQRHQLTLTGRGEPFVVNTAVVTADFFSLLTQSLLRDASFMQKTAKRALPLLSCLAKAFGGAR